MSFTLTIANNSAFISMNRYLLKKGSQGEKEPYLLSLSA
jgi:hypothetical protein